MRKLNAFFKIFASKSYRAVCVGGKIINGIQFMYTYNTTESLKIYFYTCII